MSILIKGMKMPINCQICPFVQEEYPIGGEALVYRCRCTFTQKLAENPAFERNNDCPLAELPPHGRLIDADVLIDMMPTIGDEYLYARETIEEAPTVIEAEKGEE